MKHAISLACLAAAANAQPLPPGTILVANQQSASASLIDLRTEVMQLIPVGTGPHEAQVAPSGRVGVVTIYGIQPAGNELAVVDIPARRVIRTISLGTFTRPHGAVFMPGDESRVVVTSEATQRIVVVNLADGRVEADIPTNAMGSHMVALTADGKRAFTANISGGSVTEIDLVAKAVVRVIPVAPRVEGIAVTPDGSTVWAGSNTNGTVSIIETRTGTIVKTLTGFTLPYRLAISADGRTAIICDPQANKIHVADIASRSLLWALDGLASPRGVTMSADGKTAFVTLGGEHAVAVVDLATRAILRKFGVGQSPDGVGYGPAAPGATQQRVDFTGEWTRAADTAGARPTVAATGDASFRRGDMGSGWASPVTITQQPNRLVVEYAFFSTYDLQPKVRAEYALDGSESVNTVMLGHAPSVQRSTAAWSGNSLVVTTKVPGPAGPDGRATVAEVRQALTLESPTTLAVETTRVGILGGATTTTRTTWTRR